MKCPDLVLGLFQAIGPLLRQLVQAGVLDDQRIVSPQGAGWIERFAKSPFEPLPTQTPTQPSPRSFN